MIHASLMRGRYFVLSAFAGIAIAVAGCSGGGTAPATPPAPAPTGAPTSTAGPTAAPTPSFPPSIATSITAGSNAASVALGGVGGGFAGTVSIPATTSGAGVIPLLFAASAPAGTPVVTSVKRVPQTIGVALVPIAYLAFTPSAAVTFPTSPAFSLTLAPGYSFPAGASVYVGFYDPTATGGWVNLDGPGSVSGSTLTFAANPVPMSFKAGVTYTFGWYSTAAVVPPLATPSPTPTPSPSPSPTPSPTPSPSPTATGTSVPGPGTPLAGPSLGPTHGWGPFAVANALAFPVQSGFNGAGTTIAIVNDSNVVASDLAQYLAFFQIPLTSRTVTVAAVDSASTVPGVNDATEATLDLETVAGLAPGANLVLYVTPSLSSQFYNDAFNQIITDGKANVVSLSFAGCESVTSPGTSAIIANAVQAGIAFVSASGDQGSVCFNGTSGSVAQYVSGVGYPASDPNVIAVGGTETNASLLNPVAWNDSLSGTQLASGGGVSTTFPIPAYQSGVAGAASAQFRNVPDIAMPAVSTSLYLNGAWQLESGTSWASPEFGAMLAETSQYCNAGLTNAAAIPYAVFAAATTAFLDIAAGNNSVPYGTGSSLFYTAHAGYDNVTGLGVPLGMPFARTLCPNRVPSLGTRRAASATAAARPARAYSLDVVPKLRGLADLGQRSAGEPTRIQLILLAAPTLAVSEQAVLVVLQSAGFHIERTFGNHLVVDAAARSAAVEQLIGTQMHDVAQGKYGTRYMPSTPITVPASLAPYVAAVSLDNVVDMANPKGR